jgi:twitching motility protein PilT
MPAANSIDELLERMVEANASDLHVTTGTPPAIRVRGEVERLEGFDPLTGEETQQLLYRILSSEQQKHFELNRQLDFSTHANSRRRPRRHMEVGGIRLHHAFEQLVD